MLRALTQRPGLLAAVDAVRDRGAAFLVAYRRDRFARDVIVAAQLERLVERSGGQVVTVDGAGEGSGPEAALFRRIVDAFAEYERALIRHRTRAALAAKRARGEAAGSEAPYEFRHQDGRLEVDLGEQAARARALQLRDEHLSLSELAVRLTAEGLRPRGRLWHPNSVKRLLR